MNEEKEANKKMMQDICDIILMHRNDVLKFNFEDLATAIMGRFPDLVLTEELMKKNEALQANLVSWFKKNEYLEKKLNEYRAKEDLGKLIKDIHGSFRFVK